MKFRFPIVIIDEDFRSGNTSGLGIRALAEAIEGEGVEVVGVTSYGDLSQFAQQQSRASAFILSIDDEEFNVESSPAPAIVNLRKFIEEIRFKNSEIPIFLYGKLGQLAISRTTFSASCTASSICSRIRRSLSRDIFFGKPNRISTVCHHRSSEPWSTTPKMVRTHGTAPDTPVVLHSSRAL